MATTESKEGDLFGKYVNCKANSLQTQAYRGNMDMPYKLVWKFYWEINGW